MASTSMLVVQGTPLAGPLGRPMQRIAGHPKRWVRGKHHQTKPFGAVIEGSTHPLPLRPLASLTNGCRKLISERLVGSSSDGAPPLSALSAAARVIRMERNARSHSATASTACEMERERQPFAFATDTCNDVNVVKQLHTYLTMSLRVILRSWFGKNTYSTRKNNF